MIAGYEMGREGERKLAALQAELEEKRKRNNRLEQENQIWQNRLCYLGGIFHV